MCYNAVFFSGALIVREHDCVNASTAAFLDITHGLYSLSWSSPVEWPDFLTEYKVCMNSSFLFLVFNVE
jgi:hypothetical protein